MAKTKFIQGIMPFSKLKHPEKYIGKQKENIIFRSSWEKSFIWYIDSNDAFIEWSSEEIVIPYKFSIDNRIHRYFPDFYVKFKLQNGTIKEALIELKPWNQTIKPVLKESQRQKTKDTQTLTYIKNQDKWVSAKIYCRERRWDFYIITERDILFNKRVPI